MDSKIIPQQLGVIFPAGAVYRDTTEELVALAQKLLAESLPRIALSFVKVKSLLSDGIRALVVINDLVVKQGCEFFVTDLSREVKYTLQITNIITLVKYSPTLEDLLVSIGKKAADLMDLDAARLHQEKISFGDTQLINLSAEELSPITPITASAPPPITAPIAPPAPKPEEEIIDLGMVAESVADPSKRRGVYGAFGRAFAATQEGGRSEAQLASAAAEKQTSGLSLVEYRRIARAHTPGRICFDIYQALQKINKDLFSIEDVFILLRDVYKPEQIEHGMKQLAIRGTITSVGGGMYNMGSSGATRAKVAMLTEAFNNRHLHSSILKILVEMEQKP